MLSFALQALKEVTVVMVDMALVLYEACMDGSHPVAHLMNILLNTDNLEVLDMFDLENEPSCCSE